MMLMREQAVSKMLKDDLTIICPLHYRENFLDEFLEYYDDFPCKIILTDSTDKPMSSVNYSLSKKYKDHELFPHYFESEEIIYIHEPNEVYYRKMFKALDLVETPYVVEIPDDDVIYKDAIKEVLSFLKQNQEYQFAQGRWHCGEELFWKEPEDFYIKTNFYSDDRLERIDRYLTVENWQAPNHCVVRTDLLKEIYGYMSQEQRLWPIRWFDKIWFFMAGYRSNYKVLDVKYGRSCPTSMLRVDQWVNIQWMFTYPVELEHQTYWSHFKEKRRKNKSPLNQRGFIPLVEFLEKDGMKREEAFEFVKEIANRGL